MSLYLYFLCLFVTLVGYWNVVNAEYYFVKEADLEDTRIGLNWDRTSSWQGDDLDTVAIGDEEDEETGEIPEQDLDLVAIGFDEDGKYEKDLSFFEKYLFDVFILGTFACCILGTVMLGLSIFIATYIRNQKEKSTDLSSMPPYHQLND